MKVLMHSDGGANVGLGHASRCSALFAAFTRAGHLSQVLIEPSSELAEYLSRLEVPHIEGPANPASLCVQADRIKADVVIIDSYRWSETDFVELRQNGRPVVVFDDLGKRKLPVDAVINGAPSAFKLPYKVLPHTLLWLGPQYQVVREEFRDAPIRKPAQSLRNLIVLVGGDDLLGLLPSLSVRLSELAAAYFPPFQIELICGPYCALPETSLLANITLTVHPRNLRQRMISADLALSASGQTLFELACCGTPTIAFCTGEDQAPNLAAMAALGIVWNAGRADQPHWFAAIEEGIRAMAIDLPYRDLMSIRAQHLVDGNGSDRLVFAISEMMSSRCALPQSQTST